MAAKRLIVVVESTAAMGPYWETILRDYLDKIIRGCKAPVLTYFGICTGVLVKMSQLCR
ncbi:hypothetical protein JHK85_001004 [Glycine max]|nr:hypothetical protein JHK85_001004 [Glycine max]